MEGKTIIRKRKNKEEENIKNKCLGKMEFKRKNNLMDLKDCKLEISMIGKAFQMQIFDDLWTASRDFSHFNFNLMEK